MTIYLFSRQCFYSLASSHKKRPNYFHPKLCYLNLINTLDERVKLTFLLDTFFQKDQPHFVEQQKKYPVIPYKAGTEASSFLFLLDYVSSLKLKKDDIVYFLEDDYLHRPGWPKILEEGFSYLEVDYLTLYDHRDKYFYPQYKPLKSSLWVSPSCHWRETPSTTNTYAMRFATLKKHLTIHQEFSKGVKISKDHEKFIHLQNQNAKLASSIPGWASHLENSYESPCIDWEKVLLQTAVF